MTDCMEENWRCFDIETHHRTMADCLAFPHFRCSHRACRRHNTCSGPIIDGGYPLCWENMMRSEYDKSAVDFIRLAQQIMLSFLRDETSPDWLKTADPLYLAIIEDSVRALIPRRRWKQLRRWLISLGVDQELLIVKSASTGFCDTSS